MQLKHLTIALSLIGTLTCFGQTTEKRNTASVIIGYNSAALKNLNFAPVYRYDYNGLVYGIQYARTTKRNRLFAAEYKRVSSTLKSKNIPALNADYATSRIGLTYLWRVVNKQPFQAHLGLQWQTVQSKYSVESATDPDTRLLIYDFQQKIGLGAQLSYQFAEKHGLQSKIGIPLMLLQIGYLDSDLYFLGGHKGILWDTKYTYTLNDKIDLTLLYSFTYDHIDSANTFKEAQFQTMAGFNFKF